MNLINVIALTYARKCIIGDLDYLQVKGLDEALHSIDKNLSWDEHLCHIFKSCHIHYCRNIKNSHYSSKNKELMYELLEANTFKCVDEIFDKLKASNELNINDWISFYNTSWVKASLNLLFSHMDTEIWNKVPENTNVAEASHANINRDGKALSLENAILKAKHYDEHYFAICNIQDKYGISKSGKKHEMQEKQLAIKEQKLELEERKVQLEREKLEIIKLKKEVVCE
ncbi:hypothetical protein F8M41_012107 [Gigaspora margarita]|uniref:Uncharacterized protein n=1 Tax=Gigaspora margarita TaxID=4874 RepID=A0A8H3X1I1_GIGMA|nr:hypothetical protein F8M41_012107 [Gigaspora margarita]